MVILVPYVSVVWYKRCPALETQRQSFGSNVSFAKVLKGSSGNGYLFAREFCELVAPRRSSREQKDAFLLAHRSTLLRWGMVVTLLYSVPILNLVAPLVATASMVHLYESLRAES